MKRLALLLTLFLCLCAAVCVPPRVLAADREAEQAAEALHDLGLFLGTGTKKDGTPIYDLDKVPTRNQAVIMLVRLLGKEDEARKGKWDIPFQDMAPNSYTAPYIGYAYANGLTKGTTAATYSGTKSITRNQYLLFLMRAMGYATHTNYQYDEYDENGKQVKVEMTPTTAADAAEKLELLDGISANPFTRGDVALLSCRALDTFLCYLKPNVQTLREALGLGTSPKIKDRPLPLSEPFRPASQMVNGVEYAATYSIEDIREKYIHYPNDPIYQEIPLNKGILIHGAWNTPHGMAHLLLHAFEDGTMIRLHVPMIHMMGKTAVPENIAYDAKTGTVTYEITIQEDLDWFLGNDNLRRAGTYRFTYRPAERTETVSEISPEESAALYVTADDCLRRITDVYAGTARKTLTSADVTTSILSQWKELAQREQYQNAGFPAPTEGEGDRMVWFLWVQTAGTVPSLNAPSVKDHISVTLLADARTGETIEKKYQPYIPSDGRYVSNLNCMMGWKQTQPGIFSFTVEMNMLLLQRELAEYADRFPGGNAPNLTNGEADRVVRLVTAIVTGSVNLPEGGTMKTPLATLVFDAVSGTLLYEGYQEYHQDLPQNH